MLDGEEVVLQVLLVLLRVLQHVVELAAQSGLVAAERLGQLGHRFVGLIAHHQRGGTQLGQHRRHDRVVLAGQRGEQVVGCQFGVAERFRLLEGRGKSLVRLESPLLRVECHGEILPALC